MTVYVDEARQYPGKRGSWCHMMTDQQSLGELHDMAEQLGIPRSRFQSKDFAYLHYDLVENKRTFAIQKGAVAVTSKELLLRCRRYAFCACGDWQHQHDGKCLVCCDRQSPADGCKSFRYAGHSPAAIVNGVSTGEYVFAEFCEWRSKQNEQLKQKGPF